MELTGKLAKSRDNDIIQQVIDNHGGIDVDKTFYGFDKFEVIE
jgi:hypothetical protein